MKDLSLHVLMTASLALQVVAVLLAVRLVWRLRSRPVWRIVAVGLAGMVLVRLVPLVAHVTSVPLGPSALHESMRVVVLIAVSFGLFRAAPFVTTLQRERDKARTYLDVAGTVLVGCDAHGRVTMLNRAGCELLGVRERDALRREWTAFVAPEHAEEVRDAFRRVMLGGDVAELPEEYRVRAAAASGTRLIAWKRTVLRDEAGRPAGLLSSGDDITERREAAEQLEFESFLLDNATDSIIVYELDGSILYANDAAYRSRGFERDEFLALEPRSWAATELMAEQSPERDAVLADGSAAFESEHVRKDGTRLYVEVRANALRFRGRTVVAAVVRDISERRQAQAALDKMALQDSLTGLANRTMLTHRLQAAIDAAEDDLPALLYVDVDRFKGVNDALGHATGDAVLQAFAARLRSIVRKGDVLARCSGDEFALMLRGLTAASDLRRVANKVLDVVRAPFQVGGREIHVTASVGGSLCVGTSDTAERLIRAADTAMSRAKEEGRDRFVFYDATQDASSLERFSLRNDLRNALDHGELELHYQPLVTLPDMHVVGAEALLRWEHGARGNVPPNVFVPLAEESGLIGRIGEWVLREACRQNKEWQRAGHPPIRVAVNLSPMQIAEHDFVETVAGILAETGLDPAWLELEITESMAMKDLARSSRVFERLRAMGISIAIDDFGTGYSSLSHIRDFPVRTLKVDRSFISDATTDPDGATIARAIILLAHSLDLNAVAEGVETPEQFAFLHAEGCDEMQGHLFSPAVPARDLVSMLGVTELGGRADR